MEYRVEKVIVMSFDGAYFRLALSLDGRGVVYVILVASQISPGIAMEENISSQKVRCTDVVEIKKL